MRVGSVTRHIGKCLRDRVDRVSHRHCERTSVSRKFPLRIPLPYSRAQEIDHRPCRCINFEHLMNLVPLI